MPRQLLVICSLFFAGAILGTGLDALLVFGQVEQYPVPVLFGVSWWVPLLFGTATVCIAYAHLLLLPLLGDLHRLGTVLNAIVEQGWILLAYLLIFIHMDMPSKTLLLGIICFQFWLLSKKSWQNLLLSIVIAITGTLVEMILVAAGAFKYTQPDLFGVPYWLPLLYICASFAIGELGRALFFRLVVRGNNEAR